MNSEKSLEDIYVQFEENHRNAAIYRNKYYIFKNLADNTETPFIKSNKYKTLNRLNRSKQYLKRRYLERMKYHEYINKKMILSKEYGEKIAIELLKIRPILRAYPTLKKKFVNFCNETKISHKIEDQIGSQSEIDTS